MNIKVHSLYVCVCFIYICACVCTCLRAFVYPLEFSFSIELILLIKNKKIFLGLNHSLKISIWLPLHFGISRLDFRSLNRI